MLAMNPTKNSDNKAKILLVDDDPIVREVMKSFIASYGFDFSTASDGLQAIKVLEKDFHSIVITDINMPNMDGMELLKYVHANYPKTGVIVVTGLSEEYTYVDVINAGAIDYMTKPFDSAELLAKLNRVIREQNLISELEKKSISDVLTNLYNRRHFDSKIVEEFYRSVRQEYPAFLALIDVDYFKGYNDTYGHQSGDNLLTTFGNILLGCVRHGVDFAFRYGGDEFALLLTHISADQAVKVLERMMANYNSYNFGETTLSCGMAEFKRNETLSWTNDISDFIRTVDKALYEAKDNGKDQIVVAQRSTASNTEILKSIRPN
nr:diguanylate cyclase [Desulfobulbaceae bacterium]